MQSSKCWQVAAVMLFSSSAAWAQSTSVPVEALRQPPAPPPARGQGSLPASVPQDPIHQGASPEGGLSPDTVEPTDEEQALPGRSPVSPQTKAGRKRAGIAPPPPIAPTRVAAPPPESTEKELERAEKEDSGRGLEFFWMGGELGTEHLGLQTFKANQLVDARIVSTAETGLLYGVGAGVRLLVLTLGARFRVGNFSSWQLWTLNGELGLHIPIGPVEPYLTLGGGYASLGAFSVATLGSSGVKVSGWDIRAGFGLDVYVSKTFSVGGNLTGDVLFLVRPAVATKPAIEPDPTGVVSGIYSRDGSSVGAGGTLTAVVGFHL